MTFIIFLCGSCLVVIAVLCAQCALSLSFERFPEKKSLSLDMHWIHPFVLRAVMDVATKTPEVWLFGKFRIFPAGSRKTTFASIERPLPAPPPPVDEPGPLQTEAPPVDNAIIPPSPEDVRSGDDGPAGAAPRDTATPRVSPLQRARSAFAKIKGSAWMRALFFMRQASWRSKILRWGLRCIGALPRLATFHASSLHVRAGLADPALTGSIFGCWIGMRGASFPGMGDRFALTIEPDFTEECLSLQGKISLRTSLMRFAALALLAIGTFPYFSTIKTWRASRR